MTEMHDPALRAKAVDLYDTFSERWKGYLEPSLEPLTLALDQSVAIDESRLALLKRASDRKRLILQSHEFLGPSEFAGLLPARFKEGQPGTNPSSTLLRMKDRGELIGIKQAGNYLYPAFQLDPRLGDVYPELRTLYRRAMEAGEIEWDIIDWLTSPQPTLAGFNADKHALGPMNSLDDVFDMMSNITAGNAEPDPTRRKLRIPIEALQNGETELFSSMMEAAFGQAGAVSDDAS